MAEKTTDALALLDAAFEGDVPYQEAVAEAHINGMIARNIQSLRKEHGLTQKQLAEMIGTKQSAISRLERAEYEGHSLSMLDKVARALKYRLEFRLVADPVQPQAAADNTVATTGSREPIKS